MARFSKAQALANWRRLSLANPQFDRALNPEPIAYGHRGSTYGADGIRIEGSQKFINAVLGRLTDLLAFENTDTRLGLSYQQVEPRDDKPTAFAGNWVCYIKVYERGDQAKMVNAFASRMRSKQTLVSAGY